MIRITENMRVTFVRISSLFIVVKILLTRNEAELE